MYRWRNTHRPPNPNSIEQFMELINSDQWNSVKRYQDGDVMFRCITGRDFCKSIIMMDHHFAGQLLRGDSVVFLHTSQTVIPAVLPFHQLVSFMCLKDKYVIPCAWALMEDDTEESFVAVFEEMKTLLPRMVITEIFATFGKDLHSSLRAQFPDAVIHGSFYYYLQELYKVIMDLNLDSRLHEEHDEVKDLLLLVMSLPLLPEEDIEEAYIEIGSNVDPQILTLVENFTNYFEDAWIEGVRPPSFSMYRDQKGLSDAFMAYESRINTKIGGNTNVWAFTKSIVKLQKQIYNDHSRRNEGLSSNIQTPRIVTKSMSASIRRIWNDYDDQYLSVPEFLLNVAHICVISTINYLSVSLEYRRGAADLTRLVRARIVQQEQGFLDEDGNEDIMVDAPPPDDAVDPLNVAVAPENDENNNNNND
ncbi:uncharacterized protein LOC122510422 [Leptopilina heterotoma]|uniref:uncharacterized protein LOC122510422 n=1 Tax=Leptopilina heterotoma TaxID=63436 RepID=UPI001CA89B62|nr:uncharacterized protein LOC122510422 [Leptopilina heterotoma]XP_043480992.1 uncharacterized protein LOC122510422 [Leptopilina heterotoma]